MAPKPFTFFATRTTNMTKLLKSYSIYAFLAFFFASCDDKNIKPLAIPDAYDGSTFVANTTAETFIRLQLDALVAEI